jgi:succinyl-CoA synthetase alpha subunit
MPRGIIFGHTGAIVGSGQGSASAKKAALRAAGVRVAERFRDILPLVQETLSAEVP